MNIYREQVLEAGVRVERHVVLNSGKHTDVKLDMERLLQRHNTMRLRAIMAAVCDAASTADVLVPVPRGAYLLTQHEFPFRFPPVIPTEKYEKRTFSVTHPAARALIRQAGRIAVFDDVVTTGGSPLAMAETLKTYNPDVALDLVAIWRRDKLVLEVATTFEHQAYLVEEDIPSWPGEECTACPLR